MNFLNPPFFPPRRRTESVFIPQNIVSTINGDSILPHIATIKSVATHVNNPDQPITLCNKHNNRVICPHCDKFFELK